MSDESAAAAQRWADDLARWGIPDHIVRAAPRSPWIHPVESFRPDRELPTATPSFRRAAEALDAATNDGGEPLSVLDVGCGGGRASLGLADRVELLVGVDQQENMLEMFAVEAAARGVECRTLSGRWPAVASAAPQCTVVVCHHVLFNVADLVPFAAALTGHAVRRVVVEIPMHHPLSNLSAAWKRFWNLDRPDRPTALDAAAVLREMGLGVHTEVFEVADPKAGMPIGDRDVEHTRVRLCLPAERDPEIREFLEQLPRPARPTVTLWWDT